MAGWPCARNMPSLEARANDMCHQFVHQQFGDHTTVVSLMHVVVFFVYIFISRSVELVIMIQ